MTFAATSFGAGLGAALMTFFGGMEEARAICEDAISAQGGPGTTFSCDGIEITVGTVSECTTDIDSATCTNTVGELNDCIAAMADDSCSLLLPVCNILITCAMSDQG